MATNPGQRKTKRVTISDVAREAGVSIAAVSRILNNSYEGFSAREETKARVFQAVEKLDYRPSRAAVRLATGRHNALALCYPAHEMTEGPINPSSLEQVFRHFNLMLVMHGITRALEKKNYDLVLTPRHPGRTTSDLIQQASDTVDGMIWIHPEDDAAILDEIVSSGLRLAIVGPSPVTGNFVNVRADEVMAGRMAMGHLIVSGARRILVAVPEDRARETAIIERLEGVRRAVKDFNDPLLGFDILQLSLDSPKAQKAFGSHLQKHGKPDGILTLSDHLPFPILRELITQGYDLPQDVKLVGFEENLTYAINDPSLTGLRYPTEDMCFKAASLLMEFLDRDEAPGTVWLTPQLITRSSCP